MCFKALKNSSKFDLLTSPITFVSSATAGLNSNSNVFLSDVDPKDSLLCCSDLEKNLKKFPSIKVIMPVHFAGATCNMKKIYFLARKYKKYIIEDAAHALGSKYNDKSMVGNCKFSDFAVFSFHPVKTITSGEGGVITTNNYNFYSKILSLRNHGINRNPKYFENKEESYENFRPLPWYYEMKSPGYHYRVTDIQASLALSQMDNINKILNRRRFLAQRYDKKFKNFKNLKTIQVQYRAKSANKTIIYN